MFELADRLVGIYKTHDATKSVTINPKMFENAVAGGAGKQQALSSHAANAASSARNVPLSDATNTVSGLRA